ncbi:site-specific DNA-methyltransferase [uncultured Desulfuromonas sp.]|uniref:site-specific DNA-methyltransferase n=1 Tax=uncultured Desulfuromonas sp. TaxID=181013 RepID=UPI00260E1DBF|nr:site-specific DNA-methyltransferase [uncultured Desulfuromonas sp.]
MPELIWKGKDKVINHHQEVPVKTLDHQYTFGDENEVSTGNKIIHGDNLEALKALLPQYEGKVKCIYIDPPYNTGNEGWVYNDNVNDPRIKKWLGDVVGKEGEDLCRHDKWLCMMYPRLQLLKRLLANDGVFLCSIDENQYHSLKIVLEEVFGKNNYLGSICWKSRNTDNRVKTRLSIDYEYVIVSSKGAPIHGRFIDRSNFKNQDNDPRGPYVTDPLTGKATKEDRPNLHYNICNPETGDVFYPDPSRGWITDRAGYEKLLADNKIWWPLNPKTGKPRKKRFLSETEARMPVSSFWADIKGQTGADELDQIMGERVFAFPKSADFISRVLDIACDNNSLILDSFAGSGTTAQAVLNLNNQDGGNRKFILIEMMDYAETITAERVRRVMDGYGEEGKRVDGTGGGFDYYTLGERVFDDEGNLNEAIGTEKIRQYVAWTEKLPAIEADEHPYWLGERDRTGFYFYYDPERLTVLSLDFLATLQRKNEGYLIYADSCVLDAGFMRKHNIRFKKIPRDISRF